MSDLMLGLSLVLVATILGSVGALFLKRASLKVKNLFKLLFNFNLYLGGLLYFVSTLIFIYALKFGQLSILYPATALGYVWIAFLSRRYFREKITKFTWLGIFFIFLGIVLLSLG